MADTNQVVLELFVQGQSARSNTALDLVRRICEAELSNQYTLEVIDIHHHPERALQAGVIATPATVRRRPDTVLRVVGLFINVCVRRACGTVDDAREPRTC